MKNIFVYIIAFFFLLSFKSADVTQKFETDNFVIEYPDLWRATNDDGIINIFPDNEIGAITISGYRELELNEEQTKMLILDVIGSQESAEKVSVKKIRGGKEYSYEFVDEKQKAAWKAKVIANDKLLYLVTIFCESKYWNGNYKNLFIESYNSFKIK